MSDAATLGQIIGGVVSGAAITAGAIAEWLRRQRLKNAETDADIAESRANAAASGADEHSYRRFAERIDSLESDARITRQELAAIRRQFRHAEDHIAMLERAMRSNGMTFTPYEPLRLDN